MPAVFHGNLLNIDTDLFAWDALTFKDVWKADGMPIRRSTMPMDTILQRQASDPWVSAAITPAIHDGQIYWSSGSQLYCADPATGKSRWMWEAPTPPPPETGVTPARFVEIERTINSSPVFDGAAVVVCTQRGVFAMDAKLGYELWEFLPPPTVRYPTESGPVVRDGMVYTQATVRTTRVRMGGGERSARLEEHLPVTTIFALPVESKP
jgi:outer membrane protein assembly factor BamB